MTNTATTGAESKSPLDAAQKIVAELQGMSADNQSLALQFAMQTLRLSTPTAHPTASSPPSTPPVAHSSAPTVASGPAIDIKSFTLAKAPQSDQQFTAIVAYYYQFEAKPSERKEAIDADTMKEAARLTGRRQVARWAMTLTNAKNAGYLNSVGDGKFTLSPVGENLVAITLPSKVWSGKNNSTGTGKKPTKKKTKTTTKAPKKKTKRTKAAKANG